MTTQPASVRHVQTCDLKTTDAVWSYAIDNTWEIDRHWEDARARNPNFFDGGVWLVSEVRFDGATDTLHAALLRTRFRAYLYWRARGFESAGVFDGFGAALVRANNGAILLARQREGHVNAGLYYPPAGFIDDQDVMRDGVIDVEASIARETQEELGLDVAELRRSPGFWVVQSGAQLAIAAVYHHACGPAELTRNVQTTLSKQENPELSDVIFIDQSAVLKAIAVPDYVRPLLDAVLGP